MKKFTLIAILLISACGGSAEPTLMSPLPTNGPAATQPSNRKAPASASEAAVGKPFALNFGESVEFPEADLSIRFEAVLADSRCPANVQCIIAGWASVLLSADHRGQPLAEITLTSPPGQPDQVETFTLEGYTLRLVEINPYPQQPGEIQAEAYSLTLVLEGNN